MSDLNTNKVKKDKKRRRRNYDDIDNQIQKIEEDTKIKQVGTNTQHTKALEDVDSDDLNDDELDKLMLLEEEKEKLLNKTESKDDESEESFELSAVEDVPTRRTRGKVIDYKKTAEELTKEDEEQDYDSDEDAEYVPEE